jgi:predicted transcriptional regulator
MSDNREPTQVLTSRVPAQVRDELERMAEEDDRTLSAVVRRCLTEYLREREEGVAA